MTAKPPRCDQQRSVEIADLDEARADGLEQDQGDEQVEARAEHDLGQFIPCHVPGAAEQARPPGVHAQARQRTESEVPCCGRMTPRCSSLFPARATRCLSERRVGAAAQGMRKVSLAENHGAQPQQDERQSAAEKRQVEGNGGRVVEVHASIDFQPGLVEPAEPPQVQEHQGTVEPRDRASPATTSRGRRGRPSRGPAG